MKEPRGIVYILDGAGSSGFTPYIFEKMLAKLPFQIEQFKWGAGSMRVIADITNRDNIRVKAAALAANMKNYRKANPSHRIYLIAKSAGTGVALLALGQLPPDCVDSVVLMSPAVSPAFSLSEALRAVRGEMVSFWSPLDLFWLGLGTTLYGTADGVKGRSAGLVGFSSARQAKFREVRWEPSMMLLGHFGGHSGNSMPPFVDKYILPIITADLNQLGD